MKPVKFFTILAFTLIAALPARAADTPVDDIAPAMGLENNLVEVPLIIKHHEFEPSEIRVPAGQRIKIMIDNQDPTAETFVTQTLGHEKVVEGNSQGTLMLEPIEPGTYPFIGKLHEETAQGSIIVK